MAVARRACAFLGLTILAFNLTACFPSAGTSTSNAGKEACRERGAQAPPGTSLETRREQYRQCLTTIDVELQSQAKQTQAQRATEEQHKRQEELDLTRSYASAAARYSRCRLMQDQVIAAEQQRLRALGPAMVATRQFGEHSPEAERANEQYRLAEASLERLIPADMRAGKPLIPDAVDIYKRCDSADFND